MTFNPFAAIGDYKSRISSETNDIVSTSYLTALPDPQQFANQQFAFVFKLLLKKDERTKLRALAELNQLLNANISSQKMNVDDQIHLAYIQLYAKLSIDISPLVRTESHVVLSSLYTVLGKKSSKYLEYSVGLLLCGKFDSDARVSAAATKTLDTIFPGEKQTLLVSKLKFKIIEFIYDCFTNANILTLSDERYTTKEHAVQKYTQLLKCCLDILDFYPVLFDLENEQIESLLESGKLWKYFCSQNKQLNASAIKLAKANLENLELYVPEMWKQLMKAGRTCSEPDVDLNIAQMMNILTKKFPYVWLDNYDDSMRSLAQFVRSGTHGAKFWPLLYNLALIIPKDVRDLTPLYEPLRKVGNDLSMKPELVDSYWGCFVMLSSEMGEKYQILTVQQIRSRCTHSRAPIKILSKYLLRIFNDKTFDEMKRAKPNAQFLLVLAGLNKEEANQYVSDILKAQEVVNPEELETLLEVNPRLDLPNLVPGHTLSWVQIACIRTEYAEKVVQQCLEHDSQLIVLEHAKKLDYKQPGVLDSFVMSNDSDLNVLENAVNATNYLVSENVGKICYEKLVSLSMDDKDVERILNRVTKSNDLEFVNKEVANMSIQEQEPLDLGRLNSSSPYIITNFLRLEAPISGNNSTEYPDIASYLDYLDFESFPKLAVLNEFLYYWYLAAPISDRELYQRYFDGFNEAFPVQSAKDISELRVLVEENAGVPFIELYSALALARAMKKNGLFATDKFNSQNIDSEPLKQTLNLYLEERVDGLDAFQNELAKKYHEGMLHVSLWKFVAPNAGWEAFLNSNSDEYLCFGIDTLQSKVKNLDELAFESSSKVVQYAALQYLESADLTQVVNYAQTLEISNNADAEIAKRCLDLVRNNEIRETDADWMELLQKDDLNLQSIATYLNAEFDVDVSEFDIDKYPAMWLIKMRLTPQIFTTSEYLNPVFLFISKYIQTAPAEDGTNATLARKLLQEICTINNSAFREFYRDNRDRQLLKKFDTVLSTEVVPKIMRQLKDDIKGSKELKEMESGDTALSVNVNETLREIKAYREVEDEFSVEIVLVLPETYPSKPVAIDIRNLSAVSVNKKRAWLLDARNNCERKGILAALLGLLTHLENFLNGVEPCAICYMLLDDNSNLPKRHCSQCHNVYHSDCLYKWFTTNRDKLCPMCRAPM